ncbi:hypothetical protein P2E05_13670 [Providencia stuartii]|uniref:hypothetical protein n=1 Tax=Providencia TaxID=586 RepID=UPI0013A76FA8|nr:MULTISPECIES: hypothetical protein [Providencia]ELR5143092.1 hypothetical protein [Providencia stuartii]MBG5920962.1 hypothetical protein [Providencia stuartii]QIC16702.1 hypothetical protein G3341_13910 [Providencia vermicola]WER21141.1 hypothetical protein P2E04_13665 [Providencia stuartii]WER25261.1 hypothetical protein P2E05_13670 [Providencia stuartii]
MKNKMAVMGQGFSNPKVREESILNVISDFIYPIDVKVKYYNFGNDYLSLKGLSQYLCKFTQNNVFYIHVRFCEYLQTNLVKLSRVVATALN